jgi:HEAT repeats
MRPTILMVAGLALAAATTEAQTLARKIDAVKDGTVRMSFAAKAGVCGDGSHNISTRSDRRGEWESECEPGPVRIALDRRGGRTTALRAYVGGRWRGSDAVDLGAVPAGEAAEWLLKLAEQNDRASEEAIFPAILADSVEPWPALLRIAGNDQVASKTRKSAVFWLGQAAGDAATKGLDSIVTDNKGDREVRESAIFALSQRPNEEGVPALIRVVKNNPDPELRKKALFWLGQSGDPRALKLFEDLLSAGR